MISFGNDWDLILKDEFEKPYYKALRAFLKNEYATKTIYPNIYDIFNQIYYIMAKLIIHAFAIF